MNHAKRRALERVSFRVDFGRIRDLIESGKFAYASVGGGRREYRLPYALTDGNGTGGYPVVRVIYDPRCRFVVTVLPVRGRPEQTKRYKRSERKR
jgi:hypothetical protein